MVILYFLVFRAMADFKKEVPLIIIKTVISDRIFINNFYRILGKKLDMKCLDYKEIQPVHPKGDQSWVLIGRTDVEAETPILWPPDAKS